MKKRTKIAVLSAIAILLAVLAVLAGNRPSELEAFLCEAPWAADFSEGTVATYTFDPDGTFRCDAVMTVGEKSGSMTRSGAWTLTEENGNIFVTIQYPDVNYSSQVNFLEENGQYVLELAGVILHH